MKVLGAPLGGLHLSVDSSFEEQDIFPLCVFCKNEETLIILMPTTLYSIFH